MLCIKGNTSISMALGESKKALVPKSSENLMHRFFSWVTCITIVGLNFLLFNCLFVCYLQSYSLKSLQLMFSDNDLSKH